MSSNNTSAASAAGFSQANDATCTSGEPCPLKTGSGNIMPTFSHDGTIDYDGTSDERLTLDKSRCTKLCCCQVDGCSEDTAKSCSGKTKPCASKAACDESDKGVLSKASESTSRAGNKVSQTASKFMDKVTGSNKSDTKPKDNTKPEDGGHKDAPQEGLVGDLQRKVTAGHEAGPGENPFPTSSIPPPPQTDGACEQEHQDQTDGTSCGPNGCDGSAEEGSGGRDEIQHAQSQSSCDQDQTDSSSCGPNGCDGSPDQEEDPQAHSSQTDGSSCGPNGCDGSPDEEEDPQVHPSQTDGSGCGPNGCDGSPDEEEDPQVHPSQTDGTSCGPNGCDGPDEKTTHTESSVSHGQTDGSCCGPNGCDGSPEEDESEVHQSQTDGSGCGPNGCDGPTEEDDPEVQHSETGGAGNCGPSACDASDKDTKHCNTASAVSHAQTDGTGCCDGATEEPAARQDPCRQVAEGITNSAVQQSQTDGSGCGPNGCDGSIEDTTHGDETEQQRRHAQRDAPCDARVEEVPGCTTIQ